MTSTGTLLMIGLPALTLDDSTRQLIHDKRINNFILFSRNVDNPEQLRRLCDDLKHECATAGLAPPLISIDQEGGSVARLPEPWTRFPDARLLAESPEPEKALSEFARTSSRELLEVGINMNLAPVLDICPRGGGYFMERRALGSDPAEAARLGLLIINEMQGCGVAACAKHFPGLGAARLDPHLTLPTVDRPRARLMAEDLVPFKTAADGGVAAIMTSHTIYRDLDPDNPATVSEKILTGLLRNEIHYDGLVITDDLEMGAIEKETTVAEASLKALTAGADLLLICHEHQKVQATIDLLDDAIQEDRLDRKRVVEAAERIDKVRERFTNTG